MQPGHEGRCGLRPHQSLCLWPVDKDGSTRSGQAEIACSAEAAHVVWRLKARVSLFMQLNFTCRPAMVTMKTLKLPEHAPGTHLTPAILL